MPNFCPVDRNLKFIAVDFEAQILPGTFEHAVSVLVDQELDLAPFIETYCNDDTGAPAYHPSILLKVILFGNSRGLTSSRAIAAACRKHVQFIALSADSHPDFSTIAGSVSRHGEAIQSLFTQVLVICNLEGLIGHEMFAIDGVKLPSNAAKSRSGLREDFAREAQKVEHAVEKMLAEHRRQDAAKVEPEQEQRKRDVEKIERLRSHANEIRPWLEKNPAERVGASGKPVLSNRTDNESAKMPTRTRASFRATVASLRRMRSTSRPGARHGLGAGAAVGDRGRPQACPDTRERDRRGCGLPPRGGPRPPGSRERGHSQIAGGTRNGRQVSAVWRRLSRHTRKRSQESTATTTQVIENAIEV